MTFENLIKELNSLSDWQKLRSLAGLKLEHPREYEIKNEKGKIVKIFGTTDNIFFCYLQNNNDKITKKFIRDGLLAIEDIKQAKYLVLMVQNNEDPQIIGVDLINRTNPKTTTLHIDNKGTFNIDANKILYKNRTLIEQFQELQKDLGGGERELRARYLKKFFEKQKLTESFYAIYKTELFDKIKKNLITHFGKVDEKLLNDFVLINLNRLLFIHFLDRKGGVFKEYEEKRGSYIAYLFHEIYKKLGTEESFYQVVLKPLFFEAFNKPYTERKFKHKLLEDEFKDLPYLNGGLFKPTNDEGGKLFIDNAFIKSFIVNIIDQFNFTITEDTPFEIKVSVDPELLGYIFENLIQDYDNNKNKDDERSKSGIFYTPKIEVDFMCRQVLIEYLSKKEDLKDKKLDLYKLFYPEKGGREQQEYGSFNSIQIASIFKHLEEVKVVDPACGSGAFLVGMMQVILDVENTLLYHNEGLLKYSNTAGINEIKSKTIFQRKKQIIKNTLHGVDIKDWAVEIAKLRLWLSMIVNIDEQAFQKENAKMEPLLPSFGFKIVQGDSLVNRIGTNLVPIDIANAGMLPSKMKENIQALATLKNEYYENKYRDDSIIKKKEKEIYEEILENKVKGLTSKLATLQKQTNTITEDSFWSAEQLGVETEQEKTVGNTKKIEKQLKEYNSQISTLNKQLEDILLRDQIPFARGINFSDIFAQKGGFDIVVGNPPYVRQELIEDVAGIIQDKKEYKNLLVDVVNQDWLDDIKKHKKDELKIGGRSDLYLYFYFRGLKLLNSQGVFTFITSNSWLDVDFGAVLQEFLIKYCPSIKVFDNQVQRSFASASVNTIMCFFDKPVIDVKEIMTGKAQFVNFGKTYEESIWTETMAELDHQVINKKFESKKIKTGEVVFTKRTTDELRVIDIDTKDLWLDGSESIGSEGLEARKYEGNKWGGKFLKAPEIFFTILEKGKLVQLKQIADVKFGLKTGCNEFFYLPNHNFDIEEENEGYKLIPKNSSFPNDLLLEKKYIKPVVKSPREIETTEIELKNLDQLCFFTEDQISEDSITYKYIKRGESQKYNKKPSCASRKYWYTLIGNNYFEVVWPMTIRERYTIAKNNNFLVDARLYGIQNKSNCSVIGVLQSSLTIFFMEMFSRNYGGGGGPIDTKVYEVLNLLVLKLNSKKALNNRKIGTIFEEFGFVRDKDIRSQIPNPLPDRKELDDIIFDELGLTQDERNEVYRSVAELVKARLDKAKSV